MLFFFKWNPSDSSKIVWHGRSKLYSSLRSIWTFLWSHFIHQVIFSSAIHYDINAIFPVRPQLSVQFLSKTASPVILNMYLYFFRSYRFLSFDLLAAIQYVCFMASSYLDRYWSYEVTRSTIGLWSKIKSIGRLGVYPSNKWYGEYQVEPWFV